VSLRDRVLELFRTLPPGELLTRSRVAAELELSPRERKPLPGVLEALVVEGRLRIARGRYGARPEPDELSGVFHASRGGYGFVTPEGAAEGERDLFIPPPSTGGAMAGDRVRVRAAPRVPGDRGPEGEVLSILSRSARPLVGLVRGGYLFPMGGAGTPVALPRDAGGEGRVARVDLEAGDGPPTARDLQVLGDFAGARTPILAAEARFGLTHDYPQAVRAEAESFPPAPAAEDLSGRSDFRTLCAVTIDPDDAKDFDDALSVLREGEGWRLWVHIADVSHYVREGSATDAEAFRRGNTTYLPGTAYHMLPVGLAGGLCSLVPDRDRLTFTAEMTVASDGTLTGASFHKGVIRSARRLAYAEAQRILEAGEGAEPAVLELLREARAVAAVLRRRRESRGALELELPEPELRFGPAGELREIVPAERLETHRLVEECMLLANTAVAEALAAAGSPCLYRVHDEPDPERLEPLRPLLNSLGLGEASRGDLAEPAVLRRVLAKARGHRAEKLVSYLILRGMAQARYSAELGGHFGLALERYTHFTSPIRRYPDLLVHRALAGLLGLAPVPRTDWRRAGDHCSETERLSDEAEREVLLWLQMAWLSGRLGDTFEAVVLGFTRGTIRVELVDHLVEGVCPFRLVEEDRIRVDADGLKARGLYSGAVLKVGDTLPVRLVRVDQPALEAQFVPESWPGSATGTRRRGPGRRRR